jgi:hypothetical protein
MRLTTEMLRRIIKEEIVKSTQPHRRLAEGTVENPIQITADFLNKIIREEYAAAQSRQRLAEARRRRERKVYR